MEKVVFMSWNTEVLFNEIALFILGLSLQYKFLLYLTLS